MTSPSTPKPPPTLEDRLAATKTAHALVVASEGAAAALEGLAERAGLQIVRRAEEAPATEVLVLIDGAAGAERVPQLTPAHRVLFVHDSPADLLPLLEAGFRFRAETVLDDGRLMRQGRSGAYTVSRYGEGDEDEILSLFRSAFHTERRVEHWRWKYLDCPYGNSRISLVRDASGQLVGQYCAYPVPFLAPGETAPQLVHQVGDTMTAPAVRAVGRGHSSLLASVAQHFYATFCRGRVGFNFGFNTGNIRKFSTRFVGAEEIEDVRFRVAPRDALRQRRSFFGPRARREDSFGPDFDELLERARPHYGALLLRDSRYLDWRYAQRPDLDYRWFSLRRRRLLGWGVFCRRETTLVWGDALFDPAAARHAPFLLQAALESFEAESPIERVVGWFPDRPSWWHEALGRLGFEEEPEPQDLGLVAVPFVTPREELVPMLQSDLYYSYGDSDLF